MLLCSQLSEKCLKISQRKFYEGDTRIPANVATGQLEFVHYSNGHGSLVDDRDHWELYMQKLDGKPRESSTLPPTVAPTTDAQAAGVGIAKASWDHDSSGYSPEFYIIL